jgi:hypothetical protein
MQTAAELVQYATYLLLIDATYGETLMKLPVSPDPLLLFIENPAVAYWTNAPSVDIIDLPAGA